MPRWIVFDQGTACQLRARLPQATVFEAPGRAALEYALETSGSVVTVLPLAVEGRNTIAVFRPKRTAPPAKSTAPTQSPKTLPVRATGILGLNDEAVFEQEEPGTKQPWWKLW
jgi:hypothetical protein